MLISFLKVVPKVATLFGIMSCLCVSIVGVAVPSDMCGVVVLSLSVVSWQFWPSSIIEPLSTLSIVFSPVLVPTIPSRSVFYFWTVCHVRSLTRS